MLHRYGLQGLIAAGVSRADAPINACSRQDHHRAEPKGKAALCPGDLASQKLAAYKCKGLLFLMLYVLQASIVQSVPGRLNANMQQSQAGLSILLHAWNIVLLSHQVS